MIQVVSTLIISKDEIMAVEINGQTYYRTAEVCAKAGISRATLFRWLKAGVLKKTYRDRRGWRMFTGERPGFNACRSGNHQNRIQFKKIEPS